MIRHFDAEIDHDAVSRWWKAHEFGVIPRHYLPPTGFIVEVNGVKVIAGWLYKTDSAIAWMEWIVSNPEVSADVRRPALTSLIETLIMTAKEDGFELVFTSSNHPKLMDTFKAHGFVVGDTDVSQLFRRL